MLRSKYDIASFALVVALSLLRLWLVATEQGFHLVAFSITIFGMMSLWSIKHNHIHLPIFKTKKLNKLFSKLLSFNTGTPCENTAIIHIAIHHQHNNSEEDWTSLHFAPSFKWSFLSLLAYPFFIVPQMLKKKNRYQTGSKNKTRNSKIKGDNIAILCMVILALLWSPTSALWYVILPIIFGQWFLISTNYMQHHNCDHHSEYDHSINYTGKLYNLLLFNVGYHTAHHKFPNKHWTQLPLLHKSIANNIDPLLNKPSFFKSIFFDYLIKFTKNEYVR